MDIHIICGGLVVCIYSSIQKNHDSKLARNLDKLCMFWAITQQLVEMWKHDVKIQDPFVWNIARKIASGASFGYRMPGSRHN